jgi:hypothetical protein
VGKQELQVARPHHLPLCRHRQAAPEGELFQPGRVAVMSPHRAQCGALKRVLAAPGDPAAPGRRGVGDAPGGLPAHFKMIDTVEKLQGQEAPVVIYGATASCPAALAANSDFYSSLHRSNVALSREAGAAGCRGIKRDAGVCPRQRGAVQGPRALEGAAARVQRRAWGGVGARALRARVCRGAGGCGATACGSRAFGMSELLSWGLAGSCGGRMGLGTPPAVLVNKVRSWLLRYIIRQVSANDCCCSHTRSHYSCVPISDVWQHGTGIVR